jgi:hypothetical protein
MKDWESTIRVALYLLAIWLGQRGLPPELVNFIGTDPAVIALASDVIAWAIAGVALIWWQIARRLGRAT